jgi:hypothetical protein
MTGVGRRRLAASHPPAVRRDDPGIAAPTRGGAAALSEFEAMVLMAVGYFQPVTRGELSKIFGKEVSRDVIGLTGCRVSSARGRAVRRRARRIPT